MTPRDPDAKSLSAKIRDVVEAEQELAEAARAASSSMAAARSLLTVRPARGKSRLKANRGAHGDKARARRAGRVAARSRARNRP